MLVVESKRCAKHDPLASRFFRIATQSVKQPVFLNKYSGNALIPGGAEKQSCPEQRGIIA